jgi:hypothetical protein
MSLTDDDKGEKELPNYSFHLRSAHFDIEMIGTLSGEWSCQLEECKRLSEFQWWHGEGHVVVRISDTD